MTVGSKDDLQSCCQFHGKVNGNNTAHNSTQGAAPTIYVQWAENNNNIACQRYIFVCDFGMRVVMEVELDVVVRVIRLSISLIDLNQVTYNFIIVLIEN